MANRLDKLRKQNNEQDKQLTKENNEIITDIVCYLRSSNLSEYDIETARRELAGMALESQLRNERFSEVAGYDFKKMCNEIIENGRQKTLYEKTIENAYILVYGFGILYIIEVLFSSTIFNIFKYRNFSMPITSGFLISTIATIAFSIAIYRYFTEKAFELSAPSKKSKIIFITLFSIAWTFILITKIFLHDSILFRINCLYPLTLIAASFIVVSHLNNSHADSLFKVHE